MRKIALFLAMNLLTVFAFAQQIKNADNLWYEWQPENTLEPGIIGMADWLDAPAGKHGWLQYDGSDFAFEDGTPIKFWGVNHSGKGCGPVKAEADRRVEWYAKMGVNAIRMHKFTYSNSAFGNPQNSTELTEEGWERLDYYWTKLKEKGMHLTLSPVFRHYLVDADSDQVIAYEEIKENLDRNIIYLVNFAPDLQRIMFDSATHILDHKNPHTGV